MKLFCDLCKKNKDEEAFLISPTNQRKMIWCKNCFDNHSLVIKKESKVLNKYK